VIKIVKKKVTKKTRVKTVRPACCIPKGNGGSCGGAVYGLGFVGAAIYYISVATGFWNGVWGVIKAIVWPAFLTFELMKYLGM
jgi:hypothetical protein